MDLMSFQTSLFIATLLFITSISVLILVVNNKSNSFDQTGRTYVRGASSEVDQAVSTAQTLYRQKKKEGVDFSNGPCLTNDLLPGWVADVVHNPRTAVDNLPQNQCQAYLEGRAKHFVELDTLGNLVRVH